MLAWEETREWEGQTWAYAELTPPLPLAESSVSHITSSLVVASSERTREGEKEVSSRSCLGLAFLQKIVNSAETETAQKKSPTRLSFSFVLSVSCSRKLFCTGWRVGQQTFGCYFFSFLSVSCEKFGLSHLQSNFFTGGGVEER